jgi:hypothetical protein
MTEAIFRETTDIPTPRRSRFADLEVVDVGALAGFVAVVIGLAMIWVPLAFLIPGAFVLAVCLWRILRSPRTAR